VRLARGTMAKKPPRRETGRLLYRVRLGLGLGLGLGRKRGSLVRGFGSRFLSPTEASVALLSFKAPHLFLDGKTTQMQAWRCQIFKLMQKQWRDGNKKCAKRTNRNSFALFDSSRAMHGGTLTFTLPLPTHIYQRPQQTMLKTLASASSVPFASTLGSASQQLWQQGLFRSNTLRMRLRPLRAIVTFVLIVMALESRRQQRRLSGILITLLASLQRSLESWQERLARLKRRSGGGYGALWAGRGGGKPFSGVFFWGGTGDEDGAGNTTLTAGDGEGKPFRRKVMLGDRGRARCSWMVRQQFLRHAYCDVTFVVEGRAFPAHRCWVAAFSMPLCAMFNSGMRESNESRITLRDTDAGAFQLMLNFIYGG